MLIAQIDLANAALFARGRAIQAARRLQDAEDALFTAERAFVDAQAAAVAADQAAEQARAAAHLAFYGPSAPRHP